MRIGGAKCLRVRGSCCYHNSGSMEAEILVPLSMSPSGSTHSPTSNEAFPEVNNSFAIHGDHICPEFYMITNKYFVSPILFTDSQSLAICIN